MDDRMRAWLAIAARTGTQVSESSVYMGLITQSFLSDGLAILQYGYAMVLDKPIILLVDNKVHLPAHMEKSADYIQRIDFEDKDAIPKAVDGLKDKIMELRQ